MAVVGMGDGGSDIFCGLPRPEPLPPMVGTEIRVSGAVDGGTPLSSLSWDALIEPPDGVNSF